VEQQIALKVANEMEKRLIKTFGDTLNLDNEVYYAFPTPQKLASATIDQLPKCGLSSKKADYIREVSKLIVGSRLDLEKFKNYEDAEEIVEELDRIKGIGVWTAKMTMVRGMQRFEAMPADDLGLRRVISHYYCKDRRISSEEARRTAEKWGKWKGLAAFYLIMAEWLHD
jgi:DNA-3-methyladenine glycosylase II